MRRRLRFLQCCILGPAMFMALTATLAYGQAVDHPMQVQDLTIDGGRAS